MTRTMYGLVGVAAVVVLLVGSGWYLGWFGGRSGIGGQATPTPIVTTAPTPPPTPTLAPTSTPEAAAVPDQDNLAAGRYFFEFGTHRFTFTVADAGWNGSPSYGGVTQGDDDTLAVFWPGGNVDKLFREACNSSGTEFTPGGSVDELVTALTSLEDFEIGTPTDVTVDGFSGKRLSVTVPTDVDVRDPSCDQAKYSLSPDRWYQAAGQVDDMYILDVEGERQILIVSYTPSTATEVVTQMREMLDSLDITSLIAWRNQ